MNLNKKGLFAFIILIAVIFNFTGCNEVITPVKNTTNSSNLLVHYIDVGQADSILIQVNRKNILIDAGNRNDGASVVSYLKEHRVKKLDYIVATHPHEDHIGGMSSVLKDFTIGDFYAPKKSSDTKTFENMVTALNGKKIFTIKAGVKLDLGEDTEFEFLAPNSTDYKETNDYSAVVKLTYGNNKFLFMGDAEKLSEDEILIANYDIKSDVLKVGHHGSSTSSSRAFLDKVKPTIAVISVGKDNDYGHPNKETLSEFKKRNYKLFRTDIDGTIVLESDGKSIKKQ
jgi:competence protein ComEC